MDITVPNRIHLGFLGLCFASLDEIGDMRGQHHAQNLADILCPEFSRHNPLEPEWFDHHSGDWLEIAMKEIQQGLVDNQYECKV